MADQNTKFQPQGIPTTAALVFESMKNSVRRVLEDEPLHSELRILNLFNPDGYGSVLLPGEIRVHCGCERCGGIRRHSKTTSDNFRNGDTTYGFAVYRCTDCTTTEKIIIVKAMRPADKANSGTCIKIYQEPPFGEPIPKGLFHVIGEANREHFLQARRSIARGLGIGAYSYYRRNVENTKFDLVDSILEVAAATNAPLAQIELLKKAQLERQFSKALSILTDVSAIPPILLIDGHNPLSLLHDLLSEGIHELCDAECLQRAREAEVILCEIADRMRIAMTERKEVKAAMKSIMSRKKEGKSNS
jgi:hypothetical protein